MWKWMKMKPLYIALTHVVWMVLLHTSCIFCFVRWHCFMCSGIWKMLQLSLLCLHQILEHHFWVCKTAASWLYLITLIGLCDVQKEIKKKSMKILSSFYKVSCNHCIHVTKRIQCHLTCISLKNQIQSTPVTMNPYVTDFRLQNCSKWCNRYHF